jgi:hypothetical protein
MKKEREEGGKERNTVEAGRRKSGKRREGEAERRKRREERLVGTHLALRSSFPVASFLLRTKGNLLLTTIMLPLDV